jgi:hypothetical protein
MTNRPIATFLIQTAMLAQVLKSKTSVKEAQIAGTTTKQSVLEQLPGVEKSTKSVTLSTEANSSLRSGDLTTTGMSTAQKIARIQELSRSIK